MARAGDACQAHRFGSLRPALAESGVDVAFPPSEDDVVYLQANFSVTRDVTLDDPLFEGATERWVAFCGDVLGFRPDTTPEDRRTRG